PTSSNDDDGANSQNRANPLRQSAASSTQPPNPKTSTAQASAPQPTTNNALRDDDVVPVWLPYRPIDTSISAQPADSGDFANPSSMQPPAMMPQGNFAPLPNGNQPLGRTGMNGAANEWIHGMPSQAASYPSSGQSSGNCENCAPGQGGMYGNGQD